MDNMSKRVTIFAGHYGSGKTNVAVNYAIWQSEKHPKVSIADLDIVNPYFRSKDSEKILREKGIRLISSEFANSNVDTPALPAEAYSITADKECRAVVDVGGDDRGALALGRFVPDILRENNYEMYFVVNKYRPLTPDADSAIEVMREIEFACKMSFTGIINNSNIGEETTADTVTNSFAFAEEISAKTGLPVVMTTVDKRIFPQIKEIQKNAMPLTLYVRQSWQRG